MSIADLATLIAADRLSHLLEVRPIADILGDQQRRAPVEATHVLIVKGGASYPRPVPRIVELMADLGYRLDETELGTSQLINPRYALLDLLSPSERMACETVASEGQGAETEVSSDGASPAMTRCLRVLAARPER